jgi:hypothetical protein
MAEDFLLRGRGDSSSELPSTVARRALIFALGVSGVPGGDGEPSTGEEDLEEAIGFLNQGKPMLEKEYQENNTLSKLCSLPT